MALNSAFIFLPASFISLLRPWPFFSLKIKSSNSRLGVRVWCLWFWVKQTAGFSHRVMEGVCLCSLLCVSEFVHCLGVSNLLTFPCAFWGHIHSELSVAAPYDLLRAAEAADICACEDHVMRVNVGIKMNASGHEGNLCSVSFYREITCNVTPRWRQSGRTFK